MKVHLFRTARAAMLVLLALLGLDLHFSLAAEESRYLTGRLLVATPEMSDPRFFQTVLYIVKHDDSGAMGLVVNRPLARGPIADLLKSFGEEAKDGKGEIILHYGGPVAPQQAFILHSDDYTVEGTKVLQDGIAFSSSVELLRALSLGKGPKNSLFMLGYAGWAPGQLETELKADAWIAIPMEKELIFGPDAETKWQRAFDKRRIGL